MSKQKLTLEYLKQHEVYHAGPGVAGIIIKHDEAYHFYTAKAARNDFDNIHSHSRSFTSTILRGEICNHIYEIQGIDPIGSKFLVNKECEMMCGKGGCAPHKVVQSNLHVVKVDERITKCGESYNISYKEFHELELLSDGPVVTRMHFSKILQPNTQVIVDKSYLTNKCCPLEVSEEVLWGMVELCLPKESTLEYELIDGGTFG